MIENPPNFYPKYLYFRFYLPTDGNDANADELGLGFNSYYAFFRNPHLSRNEQYIMRHFCDTDEVTYKSTYIGKDDYKYYMYYREIYDKYFGSLTGIVMVPRHSALPLCLGGADFDGDLVSIVYNQDVVDAVASGVFVKAKTKLFGEVQMRNLPVIEIPSTLSEKTFIKEHVPYEHIKKTFSNRIGQISDASISIGQMEYGHVLIEDSQSKTEAREQSVENESKEEKYSKPSCAMCTILTGLEIDAAKNGEHPNLDSILSNDIEKCSYIKFLHKFKKLRGEANYSFDNLKVEVKESNGKNYIEVTAKDCKTVAKFYPPVFGTFINELPIVFNEMFDYYSKGEGKDVKDNENETDQEVIVFPYAKIKEEEAKIKEFKSKCQNVFDYNFHYAKKLMFILSEEKNKGFFAIENLEKKLYQTYDEKEAVRIQRTVVPRLLAHLKACINDDNTVLDVKGRLNQEKWLFVPMNNRAAVLEEIIGGGFTVDSLDDVEKEVLFNFHNRGYINLWLILSIIEGPKTKTFDEIMSSNIKCNIKNELFKLTKEDIKELNEDTKDVRLPSDARQKLDQMIGLESVKKVINKAVANFRFNKLCMERGIAKDKASLHMVFTGNPGTAKTTVARLFANILKDEKVLSSGTFVETGRADLVGDHVGSTAKLVKRKFKEAQGGVLFIDEAYSLCDGYSGGFGDEAINTLVQEMENHREDVIVILAGYPKPMEEFLNRNPGMKSRIAFEVQFEDYSVGELVDIAKHMVSDKNRSITKEAIAKLRSNFEIVCKSEDYGNGRYVRKMLEEAEMNLAERCFKYDVSDITDEILTTIEAEDIPEAKLNNVSSKIRIGFAC